jgi:hypothetical protein
MSNPWITHVKKYHNAHPKLSYSEALREAKSSYKKVGKGFMNDPEGIEYTKKHKNPVAIKSRGKGKMSLQVERPIGIVPDMRRPERIEKWKGF